jgi:micrococcal nuclease
MILEAAFAIAIDGDTLALRPTNCLLECPAERVRLWGIDAPEMREPRGRAAKAELAALLSQGTTTCHVWTKDRYGRHVGMCFTQGRDLAWQLVAANLAEDWFFYSKGYYAR